MSFSAFNQRRAFTLIEAIMTVAIITVLGSIGGFLMSRFIQQAVFLPRQLNLDMVAADAMDIMINGDQQAKGLRYCRRVLTANNNRLDFINQDGYEVNYRFQDNSDRIQRQILDGPNAVGWTNIPYYVPNGITLTTPGSQMFNYYNASESVTGTAGQVRRVEIVLTAVSGTGNFSTWGSSITRTSSVTTKRYQ